MKLEEVLKMDLSGMTPQQRSHLRKRLYAAGMPIPPELASRRGGDAIAPCITEKADAPYKCVVVDSNGQQRTFEIVPDGGV